MTIYPTSFRTFGPSYPAHICINTIQRSPDSRVVLLKRLRSRYGHLATSFTFLTPIQFNTHSSRLGTKDLSVHISQGSDVYDRSVPLLDSPQIVALILSFPPEFATSSGPHSNTWMQQNGCSSTQRPVSEDHVTTRAGKGQPSSLLDVIMTYLRYAHTSTASPPPLMIVPACTKPLASTPSSLPPLPTPAFTFGKLSVLVAA